MSPASRRWIHRVLRWSLGVVLIAAAVGVPGTEWGSGKLRHPHSFAKSIRTYQMVPAPIVFPMAVYLPWLELTVGVVLLTGLWRRESLIVALLLGGMFLAANLTAMARGLEVDCGCFGAGYHGSAAREAVIAVAMIAATVLALALIRTPDPSAGKPSPD